MNLHIHEAAVFSRRGQAILKRFRGEMGNNEGMNFVKEDISSSNAERVRTVSLNQFCRDQSIDHVDLLRLDVRGQEYSALEGAELLIRVGRIGTIFMELNRARSAGNTCAATEAIQFFVFTRPAKVSELEAEWRVVVQF